MKLTVLGTGDAFSAERYSSSFVIEHADYKLLIDCPHPIRKMLRESSSYDIADVDCVILTHLHADHASGLEACGFFSRIALNRPLKIITHPDIKKDLWDTIEASMGQMLHPPVQAAEIERYQLEVLPQQFKQGSFLQPPGSSFFNVLDIDDEQLETTDHDDISITRSVRSTAFFGPFALECRRTIHHIPTFAWRISASGKTIAYSSDTCFDPKLVEWLAEDSNLIVHETGLGPHTPHHLLATLDEKTKAKMRLIHYPDGFTSDQFSLLEQGQIIDV